MGTRKPPRYCRCGTRLARDNNGQLCGLCQQHARDTFAEAPEVSPEFWQTDQLQDALGAWHMGQVVQAYRAHPWHGKPLAQGIVASWAGMTQTQLSRMENGPPPQDLTKLIQWAQILRIPAHLLWFKVPGASARVIESASTSTASAPASATALVSARPMAPTRIGAPPGDSTDASAMQGFRTADRQVGGGHLYATVVGYLHSEVAPRLFGGDPGTDGRGVFCGAAALTEMAGWMAHDAGRDVAARRHFDRALDLVRVAGDRQLGSHILASLSHLAHHVGKPDKAIRLAERGHQAIHDGPRVPELEGRLLAMQARGFASLQESTRCTQLLAQAENTLASPNPGELSPWVSGFDEGALASEVARCMHQLGDLGEAERQAQRIIALRPGDRARSRAFGQLLLVKVLVGRARLDEACMVAQQVLDATQSLSSYLVMQQLLDLQQLLAPHRGSRVVADFLDCLSETLRERTWLAQWLANDNGSVAAQGTKP